MGTRRVSIGWVFLTVVVSIWIGAAWHKSASDVPSSETKTVTKTVTETKEVEVEVPVPTYPQSCLDASDIADDMAKNAIRIDNSAQELLDFISRFRIAVAMDDINEANDIETELRDYSEKNIGFVVNLSELTTEYNKARDACKDDLQ